MKKAFALLLALVLIVGLFPAVHAAGNAGAAAEDRTSGTKDEEVFLKSGLKDKPDLSKEEIRQLLAGSALYLPRGYGSEPEDFYAEEASVEAPYEAGAVNSYYLETTLARLNAMRSIIRLGTLELDPDAVYAAQCGALLLVTSPDASDPHHPAKPDDMDYDYYVTALSSLESLALGGNIYDGINALIDDTDINNMGGAFGHLGHRRSLLNVYATGCGIGHLLGNTVFCGAYNGNGIQCDYDFVAYPCSGYFPNSTPAFDSKTAWSILLNGSEYTIPDPEAVVLTISCEETGQEWAFYGDQYYQYINGDDGSFDYFNVTGSQITFRPGNAGYLNGVYTVRVSGINDAETGEAAHFAYQVEFFDGDYVQPFEAEGLAADGQSFEFYTGVDHPFHMEEDEERTYAESGNAGVPNSESFIKFVVDLEAGDFVTFDDCDGATYASCSIAMADGYSTTIWCPNPSIEYWNSTGGAYLARYAGRHCIKLVYVKYLSSESDEGPDRLRFDNIRIDHVDISEPIPTPEASDATLDEALNIEGGTLEFVNGGLSRFPFTVCREGDRTAVYARCVPWLHYQYRVSTTVDLDEGDMLVFDYKGVDEYNNPLGLRLYDGFTCLGNIRPYDNEWHAWTITADHSGTYNFSWDFGISAHELCMLDNVRIVRAGETDPLAPPEQPAQGDADGDGEITVSDALIALRASMGLLPDDGFVPSLCDVDGDGAVTLTDALLVLRFSMGIVTEL